MKRKTVRDHVVALERRSPPLVGDGERFRGYGVMGLPFTLGHVLGFRRAAVSSIGPPFTSVWHRTPEGRWTVWVDIEPARSCPRYFGAAIDEVVRAPIELEWTGPETLTISIPGERFEWAIRMEAIAATRLLSTVRSVIPSAALGNDEVLRRAGAAVGRLLCAGPLHLCGSVPNGQRFRGVPRRIWAVAASAAVARGHDAGPLGALPHPARLGDVRLPDRGLFIMGDEWIERFDPERHRGPTRPPRRTASPLLWTFGPAPGPAEPSSSTLDPR